MAERRGLPLLKPAKIRTAEFLAELSALNPDVLVVAAYGRILPDPVLAAARIMPVNVHASLLPRHRGASPVEGAILAGDDFTGVTIMRVASKMDAGPILLARAIPIAPGETQGTLKEKLAELGASALLEALEKLRLGQLIETPQDESLATYTSPVSKADSVIDWSAAAVRIERMVRAYDPWPVVRTRFAGDELLIWRAAVDDSSPPAVAASPGATPDEPAAAGSPGVAPGEAAGPAARNRRPRRAISAARRPPDRRDRPRIVRALHPLRSEPRAALPMSGRVGGITGEV